MHVASIDIGTNSTRLLILSQDKKAALQMLVYQERMTKLGAGLSSENRLSNQAMQRVITALLEYKKIIKKQAVQSIQVFATSATRDAVNQQEFLDKIFEQTQLQCRVLNGTEEAAYSFLGVISDMHPTDHYLVCDIGGGSSEFIFAHQRKIIDTVSLNIGSGRLSRTLLTPHANIQKAKSFVLQKLEKEFSKRHVSHIICTGGTAATLALMDLNTPLSNPFSAHHHLMNVGAVQKQVKRLQEKSIPERKKIIGLHPERAKVILGGALIIQVILEYFHMSATISLRDLMYGVWQKGDKR